MLMLWTLFCSNIADFTSEMYYFRWFSVIVLLLLLISKDKEQKNDIVKFLDLPKT